ncbi:unnamed protein product, partial [Ectocarpus sp. 8 AP-2014]
QEEDCRGSGRTFRLGGTGGGNGSGAGSSASGCAGDGGSTVDRGGGWGILLFLRVVRPRPGGEAGVPPQDHPAVPEPELPRYPPQGEEKRIGRRRRGEEGPGRDDVHGREPRPPPCREVRPQDTPRGGRRRLRLPRHGEHPPLAGVHAAPSAVYQEPVPALPHQAPPKPVPSLERV